MKQTSKPLTTKLWIDCPSHENSGFNIEVEYEVHHQPYEAPDLTYPGCDESWTVEYIEIVNQPTETNIRQVIDDYASPEDAKCTYYCEDYLCIEFSMLKDTETGWFNSDEFLEYLNQ